MSVRNLEALFRPKSVALIGASRRPASVGQVLARNLFHGDFQGPIMPVHPERQAVEGVLAYPSVATLPQVPDLAVIATPPETVPGLIAELGAAGTRGAVVISAGFDAAGPSGQSLKQELLNAARPYCLRVVGPNCLGIQLPGQGLNASFSHIAAGTGDLAFVTQSGALVTAMLDWATPKGIGFSHVISLGSMSDVDFGDMLDFLAIDPGTRAILLYVEAITHARKFMSAARAAARVKPVIVIKSGRFAEGAKAATSHTGALAGSDEVYDAAFRRAGMLRVKTLDELFAAAETLSNGLSVPGDRVAIVTNGGGLGVLATDALIERGGRLSELSTATMKALDSVLPATWSRANPVDIIGDADGARYAAALEPVLADPAADAVMVLYCPTAVADPLEVAGKIGAAAGKRRAVFAVCPGDLAGAQARQVLETHRIATYESPESAMAAVMHLVEYRRNQDLLMETPQSLPTDFQVDQAVARRAVATVLESGREWLNEVEAKDLLAAYGIPVVATRVVEGPDAAAEAAEALGFPVALKILSPDILHKSDVGGVLLQLENAETVRAAAEGLLARVARLRPEAKISGLTVQRMVKRKAAHELILGVNLDPQFGPVLLFGQGGTAVEVLRDRALALPPLNLRLARRLMAGTRVHALLRGYRDRPAAALDEIALTLVRLSHLVTDIGEVAEIDINPLLADAQGVIALDARVRVRHYDGAPADRLAIRPYPKELEETVELNDGAVLMLRPIRPEDEPALQAGFRKLTPHDVRMRFFAPMKDLDHRVAARLTQIDYTREMAFVAYDRAAGEKDLWGVVRLYAEPDNARAEFAITVRSDLKGRGLGRILMDKLLRYAAAQGIGELWGEVLADNEPMLQLAKRMAFTIKRDGETPGIMRVSRPVEAGDKASGRSAN